MSSEKESTLQKPNGITECWQRWEPIPGLSGRYFLEFLQHGDNAITMRLADPLNKNRRLYVIFEGGARAHRCSRTSYRQNLIQTLHQQSDGNWTFFRVQNSSYVQWLDYESYSIFDIREETLSFVMTNFVVDVFNSEEPIVEFCEEKTEDQAF